MTPLCELAKKYGTDKFGHHNYTPHYYAWLQAQRLTANAVLEIGVHGGASLRMWRDFFPTAQIYGIDNDATMLIKEDRITSFLADQRDEVALRATARYIDMLLTLVVDDGDHYIASQIITMTTLLPYLAYRGLYVIEDVGAYESHTDAVTRITQAIPPGFQVAARVPASFNGQDLLFAVQHVPR